MTKPVRTCETPGCEGKHWGRGLCRNCYNWSRRHGERPKSADRRPPPRICDTPGCGKKHEAKGLCRTCYSWRRRHGERPTIADRRRLPREGCDTPGCDKPHNARGLCRDCYAWFRYNGEKPTTPKGGKPKVCETPGCGKRFAARGMCNACYSWWQAHGEKPESAERPKPARPVRLCETPGCDKPHKGHGLCSGCLTWRRNHGEKPEAADRRLVRGICDTPGCGKPHKARGLCQACLWWWKRHGEKPESAERPDLSPDGPMIYKTVRMDLDLSAAERKLVWILGRHQSQMFNVGIEIALQAIDTGVPIPGNWDAGQEVLTPGRAIGTIPKHSRLLQSAGLRLGLRAARYHRSQLGKYRAQLEYRSEDIMKAKIKGDSKKLEKLERWQARTEHKLKKLEAKGTKRLFRKRKDAERGTMPALVFDDAVKVSETDLTLPGQHKLKFRKPFVIPEDYVFTGAIAIVDETRKFTRRTKIRHRRFQAHICIKKEAPVPPTPETKDDLLGIDLGIVIPVCTSTGKQIDMMDDEQERKSWAHIRYLNRCIDKKYKPGSRRHKKQVQRFRKAHRKRANRRRNASRHAAKEVTDHAQKQGSVMVVAEDLKHVNMRRSAAGTIEHPGVRVAAKRALNQKLMRSALGRLQTDIERRCLRTGIGYIKVPPQGTSQQCNACGTKGGRETQAIFLCSHCGWFANADHNAARNIRAKGWAAVGDAVDRRPGVTNKQPVQMALDV